MTKQLVKDGWETLSCSKRNIVLYEENLRKLEASMVQEEADIQAALTAGARIADEDEGGM